MDLPVSDVDEGVASAKRRQASPIWHLRPTKHSPQLSRRALDNCNSPTNFEPRVWPPTRSTPEAARPKATETMVRQVLRNANLAALAPPVRRGTAGLIEPRHIEP